METGISPILAYGTMMVIVAALALTLIVRRDLGPTAVLGGGGRFFLGAALGLGLIAFSIKLAIIAALTTFPSQIIDTQLPTQAEWMKRAARLEAAPLSGVDRLASPVWQPLPDRPPDPLDNPITPAKVALGKRLFHDTALSSNRGIACASCHDVTTGHGDDGKATAVGVSGVPGARNTPTVFNAAFQARLFWDGRAASLEEQARGPLVNPDEMGMGSLAAVEARVAADPSYRAAFDQAFGPHSAMSIDHITKAIASYERTLVAGNAPYDRFIAGDLGALSTAQKRGMWLFHSLGCGTCHSGPNFSGASLIGPRSPYQVLMSNRSDLVRRHGLDKDKGRASPQAQNGIWRVPSLRNVALTAPYFHNGAVGDLSEAVRIMAEAQVGALVGGKDSPPDPDISWSMVTRTLIRSERRRVSEHDIADIVSFLEALSSDDITARDSQRHQR